jgi:PAS domain-containing protein
VLVYCAKLQTGFFDLWLIAIERTKTKQPNTKNNRTLIQWCHWWIQSTWKSEWLPFFAWHWQKICQKQWHCSLFLSWRLLFVVVLSATFVSFKVYITIINLRKMLKNALEPPLLNAARLRLRQREKLLLKNIAASKNKSSTSLLSSSSSSSEISKDDAFVEKKMTLKEQPDYLQAARLRIRERFRSKFPDPVSWKTTTATADDKAPRQVSSKPTTTHLEDARQRIRRRVEEKVLPFVGLPTTLERAMSASCSSVDDKAIVITTRPQNKQDQQWILHVNHCWEELCGFSQDEALGKTLGSLGCFQSATDPNDLATLTESIEKGERAALTLQNSTKDGRVFENYLRVVPLYSDDGKGYPRANKTSDIVAYLGVSERRNPQNNSNAV